MPTRHGGSLANNANASVRLSFRATTTLPSASTPWTWNTYFARSSPMVVIVVIARERADMLNRLFNDWRAGRGEGKSLDKHPGVGTVEWMVERYKRDGMDDVSERSRYEYERALNLVLRHKKTIGTEVGAAPIKTMSTLGVEKNYKA